MFFAIEKKVNLYDFFEIYESDIICFSATTMNNNITSKYYFFAPPPKIKKRCLNLFAE